MMRILIVPALLAAFTLLPTLPAAAGCASGMVLVCKHTPGAPRCHCEYPVSGNPEPEAPKGPKLNKKNVPQLKTDHAPGVND